MLLLLINIFIVQKQDAEKYEKGNNCDQLPASKKKPQYEIKSSNILTPNLTKQKNNTVWCLWGASNCVFKPSQTTGTNHYFKNTINFT